MDKGRIVVCGNSSVRIRHRLPPTARPAVEDFHADHFPVRYSDGFFDALMPETRGMNQAAHSGGHGQETGQGGYRLSSPRRTAARSDLAGGRDAVEGPRTPADQAGGYQPHCIMVAATPVHEPHTLYGMATGRFVEEYTGLGGTLEAAYVSTIAVMDAMRGRGLASVLLDELMAAMLADPDYGAAVEVFRLHVLADNVAAITLYYKHGFVIREYLPEHYEFHNARHDAFLLQRAASLGASVPVVPDARERAVADMAAARSLLNRLLPPPELRSLALLVGVALVVLGGAAFTFSLLMARPVA